MARCGRRGAAPIANCGQRPKGPAQSKNGKLPSRPSAHLCFGSRWLERTWVNHQGYAAPGYASQRSQGQGEVRRQRWRNRSAGSV